MPQKYTHISLKGAGEETVMDTRSSDRRKRKTRCSEMEASDPGGRVATRRKQVDRKMECNTSIGVGRATRCRETSKWEFLQAEADCDLKNDRKVPFGNKKITSH